MTEKRERELKDLGYNLVFIWEHQFKYQLEKNAALQQFTSTLDIQADSTHVIVFSAVEPMPLNYTTKVRKTKPFNITTSQVFILGQINIAVTLWGILPLSRTISRTYLSILNLPKLKSPPPQENFITLCFLTTLMEN